jgi:UDP-glucuronate decarboxylase
MSRLTLLPASAEALRRDGFPVVVTGAGGWLGQAALEMLDGALGPDFDARVEAYGSAARMLTLRSGRAVSAKPLATLATREGPPPLILHHAFLTRDRVAALSLEYYVAANRHIADIVAAAIERTGAAGLFLPSSGAVYRPGRVLETDIAINPYGAMKVRDEERFAALAARLGVPICAIRVFNLAGPFINKRGSYALSSIIDAIHAGGPIHLRAAKPVIRSYVHVADVLNLAVAGLLGGGTGAPFDTAGEVEIEIGDLALRTAALLGAPSCPVLRPEITEPADRYVGDFTRFAALLAAHGIAPVPLDGQIHDTAEYLREVPAT